MTWLPDTKALRVVFYGRISQQLGKRSPPPAPCDPAADPNCHPPPRPPKYLVHTRTYAAEYAVEVDYASDGKKLATREHPVSTVPVHVEDRLVYE